MTEATQNKTPESIEVFISYSRKDEELREKLTAHLSNLERKKVITAWHDREISAGTERDEEIEKHLNSARVILLLISADFIASEDNWQRDVKRAMERHEVGEARVIPVLVRECDWEGTPFSKLQPLPSNRKAIGRPDNDEAFTDVAKGIRKAVEEMTSGEPTNERKNSPPKETKQQWHRRIPWRSLLTLPAASMGITLLVVVIRLSSILQASELYFYDQMMRMRSTEDGDERLLLIQITSEDLKKHGRGQGVSLADKTLGELLKKLLDWKPRVIGLDLYREFVADDPQLKDILSTEPRLLTVCKVADAMSNSAGTPAPPELKGQEERIGFSDLLLDEGGITRRQLLQMDTKNSKSTCRTTKQKEMDSFSLKIAQYYLKREGKEYKNKNSEVGNLASGNVVLSPLYGATTGGYQSIDFNGVQILLNYRSVCRNETSNFSPCSPQKIAPIWSVSDIMGDKINKSDVENKIILIGTNMEGIDTLSPTPFKEAPMQGLIMQAQMVSQLLSAALDPRPLIRVWAIWYEIVWIFTWSLVGVIIVYLCPSTRSLMISGGVAFISLYIFCLLLFTQIKLWVPFLPPALTLLATGGIVRVIRFKPQQ